MEKARFEAPCLRSTQRVTKDLFHPVSISVSADIRMRDDGRDVLND